MIKRIKQYLYNLDPYSNKTLYLNHFLRKSKVYNEEIKPHIYLKKNNIFISPKYNLIEKTLFKSDLLFYKFIKNLTPIYSENLEFLDEFKSNIIIRNKYKKSISIRDINSILNSKSDLTNKSSFNEIAKYCSSYPIKNIEEFNVILSSLKERYKNLKYNLSYYPDHDIKQFDNEDVSHRFSLIWDYLDRNNIDYCLDFNVEEINLNKNFIKKIKSKYTALIFEKNGKNLAFLLNKRVNFFHDKFITIQLSNVYYQTNSNSKYNEFLVIFIPNNLDKLINTLLDLGYQDYFKTFFNV